MERDQHVFSNEQIYTVNDSAPREQRTIAAKASTNAAAYETGILHCAQRTPLTLDREGMTMGSQTVRRRTQPLYTREQVERVEQHLAVERVLERLRVLHRLEWNRNLKQNSINWL